MKVAHRVYISDRIDYRPRRTLHLLECQIGHGCTLHYGLQRTHIHKRGDLIHEVFVSKVLNKLCDTPKLCFLQFASHLELNKLIFGVFAEDFDGHGLSRNFMPAGNDR